MAIYMENIYNCMMCSVRRTGHISSAQSNVVWNVSIITESSTGQHWGDRGQRRRQSRASTCGTSILGVVLWTVSPENSYGEAVTSREVVFGDGTSKKVIKVK